MNFEQIKQIFESVELEPFSYSGRFMYGDRCLAVSCEDPIQTVLRVIQEFLNTNDDFDLAYELVDVLVGACTDQLGMEMVLYFPNIIWEES